MEPELSDGNIEYKLKLVDKTDCRIQRLSSQMKYRCDEGYGECFYNLGVMDNGEMVGISEKEYEETIHTLSKAAHSNSYSIIPLTITPTENDKNVYEILVRENNVNNYIDVKVVVAGSVDTGKSSLIGVLTNGKLDDGRGSARLNVFNFSHEVKSGRTSSIAHHILGFDKKGKVVNYQDQGKKSWTDIVRESSKIISINDMPGHEKYLKTTILGLASSQPDLAIILVAGNKGVLRMTTEHIFLCLTLSIPFVILITKVDICKERQNVLSETIDQVNRLLRHTGVRKIPLKITNDEDVILAAKNVQSESIVPIFYTSSVTGQGIEHVKKFLNFMGKKKRPKSDPGIVEYHIDSTFSVHGVGTVTGGYLISGTVSVGDKLLIGPNNGKYELTHVRSIHCKRVPMQEVKHGSYVCFGLKKIERNAIRRGNVMISPQAKQILCIEFKAKIHILRSHSTTIRPNYQPVCHSGSVRQTVRLVKIENKESARNNAENDLLRTGDKAIITLRFNIQPEYLKVNSRILLSEGRTKIVGTVVE